MNEPEFTPKGAEDASVDSEILENLGCSIVPSGDTYTIWSTLFDVAYTTRFAKGWNTRDFHTRLRNGELLNATPWTQFESKGQILSGEYDLLINTGGANRLRSWCSNPHGSNTGDAWKLPIEVVSAYAPDTVSINPYVTQAAASIYDQGWDFLTFAAEFKQVEGLFANAARNVAKLKFIPRGWRKMASAWLAYRYGWRPLVNDVKSVVEIISHLSQAKGKRHSRHADGSSNQTVSDIAYGEHPNFQYFIQTKDEVRLGLRGCVSADIAVPALQINPIQTLWELLPWSFVFDWFMNVGRTISAVSVILGSAHYVASKGYRLTVKRTRDCGIATRYPSLVSGTFEQHSESEASLTWRNPCSIPIIPQVDVRINASRIIDSLSLIMQRLK